MLQVHGCQLPWRPASQKSPRSQSLGRDMMVLSSPIRRLLTPLSQPSDRFLLRVTLKKMVILHHFCQNRGRMLWMGPIWVTTWRVDAIPCPAPTEARKRTRTVHCVKADALETWRYQAGVISIGLCQPLIIILSILKSRQKANNMEIHGKRKMKYITVKQAPQKQQGPSKTIKKRLPKGNHNQKKISMIVTCKNRGTGQTRGFALFLLFC